MRTPNIGNSALQGRMASQKLIILVFSFFFLLKFFFFIALDEYNSAYNIGSTSLTLCCKDLTNGMVNTQETSPSSCSIRAEMDFKGTAITGCYENSLTASRKTEVVVRKKEIEMKKPKKKSKFCLFTFFCL